MVAESIIYWRPTTCEPGPVQMARDEALLLATAEDQIPRFRFYHWPTPTISLGYFQDYNRFFSVFPHLSDLTIVRRLTGGGAILHDKEITYCLTMPASHVLYKSGPLAAYILVHEAIAAVLGKFGIRLELRPKTSDYMRVRDEPEFCFARPCPTDLICPAGKLVGSAQRRLPQAFLQHGSIILERRFQDHPTTAITDLTTSAPAATELEALLAAELAARLGMPFTQCGFTAEEDAGSQALLAKYSGSDWTIHRRHA